VLAAYCVWTTENSEAISIVFDVCRSLALDSNSKLSIRMVAGFAEIAEKESLFGCGGGFEPPTFGLCDLTHLSMRVGLYLHPRGMPAIQSLRLPPPFQGLGSVLPYRSRDVGSTDFDE
jgi:hypothetical protein